jgi:LysR family hydrogen peroxide-inducible transcriptional activator
MKDILDVGIVVTPLNNRNILEEHLYYEEMMIYHHAGHRFTDLPVVQVDRIERGDLWLLGDGHCFRNQVVNFCDIRKMEATRLPYEFEGGSISTLMKIVDREGGYTLIPELAVRETEQQEQVKHFARITPLREVSLVYTRKLAKTKLISVLAEFIRRSVPAELLNRERGTVVEWR